MYTYRNLILQGKLPLPEQFIDLVGLEFREEMEAMFDSLWINYLRNKGKLSIPAWYDRFRDEKVFNKFIIHLCKAGWLKTSVIPSRNWGEMWLNEDKLLSFVSNRELIEARENFKFHHYKLNKNTEVSESKLTKIGKKKKFTGISRPGFAKAANSQFKYDIYMLEKYKDEITLNLTKSMDKILDINKIKYNRDIFHDDVDYASISKVILEYHIYNSEEIFTTGRNINDSRGRAISEALRKVFNPISNKDARALLVMEPAQKFDRNGLEAVYLFIAELLGIKKKTIEKKAKAGKKAFNKERYLELDCVAHITKDMTIKECKIEEERAEKDRAKVFENIWLERIYQQLTDYFMWDKQEPFMWHVPIELDATASIKCNVDEYIEMYIR